jgi:hypothetical protein
MLDHVLSFHVSLPTSVSIDTSNSNSFMTFSIGKMPQ